MDVTVTHLEIETVVSHELKQTSFILPKDR